MQIASAVFVRPPLAACGLTEQQAEARLTGDIDIFVSKFKPMKNTLSGRDEKTLMKIIVKVDTDEVRSSTCLGGRSMFHIKCTSMTADILLHGRCTAVLLCKLHSQAVVITC